VSDLTGYSVKAKSGGKNSWKLEIDEDADIEWCGTSGYARLLFRQMIQNKSTNTIIDLIGERDTASQRDVVIGEFAGHRPPFVAPNTINIHYHRIDLSDVEAIYREDRALGLGAFAHENAEAYVYAKGFDGYSPGAHRGAVDAENRVLSDLAGCQCRRGKEKETTRGKKVDYGDRELEWTKSHNGRRVWDTFKVRMK